jgi:hypothetical protein
MSEIAQFAQFKSVDELLNLLCAHTGEKALQNATALVEKLTEATGVNTASLPVISAISDVDKLYIMHNLHREGFGSLEVAVNDKRSKGATSRTFIKLVKGEDFDTYKDYTIKYCYLRDVELNTGKDVLVPPSGVPATLSDFFDPTK